MELLRKYPILTEQMQRNEIVIILSALEELHKRHVDGDVVELGCYVGTTTLFLRRFLMQVGSEKALHVYDSFTGLPPKTAEDSSPVGEQFAAGELRASRQIFIKHFKQAGLPLPVIHKAWFADLTPDDMPDKIAFAFLDGDFYSSIHDSLKLVWPRLTDGAIVIVDDYQSESLPGAKRAVDEWLVAHPARLHVSASLAIIRP